MEETPVCPSCGSKNVARIVYGLPSALGMEEARRGKVVFYGRVIPPDPMQWHCRTCLHEWADAQEENPE